jgi:hypothetical protein
LNRVFLVLIMRTEVVASNPTRSISSILVNYGIKSCLFSVIVGQNQPAMPIELYFTLQDDLRTSQTLYEALRDISIVALLHLFLEFNDH